MMLDVDLLYRQHLTDVDRRVIARAAGTDLPLAVALGHPDLEAAVFVASVDADPLAVVSPFLTFAVAVHRTAAHLATATFVEEWTAPRQRLPVFDVASLRDFLDEPMRRYFLVELLASYTHVASGVSWARTARGWRKRKFSELDPVRLAELLTVVDATERAGVFRRLGDLALFLTGVFPDHADVAVLDPLGRSRIARFAGLTVSVSSTPGADDGDHGVEFLSTLGARCYRAAAASVPGPLSADLRTAAAVGERFTEARRVLGVVTDRYLFPLREQWFGR
jgi:hypothetical protein